MKTLRNAWFFSGTALLIAAVLVSGQLPLAPADADKDGIPDDWETNGVTVTSPDGTTKTLDLKSPTSQHASPTHKDVIVWVDWMGDKAQDGTPVGHNHRPLPDALEIVRAAYANATLFTDSPDQKMGINLIIWVSPTPVPHVNRLGDGKLDGTVWRDFNPIRDGQFPAKLKGVVHYCLFAHDVDDAGSSGFSFDIGAYDFIVSLGQFEDPTGKAPKNATLQAGTFMHELGHNLGLRHGGADDLGYKPNYLSVMNYLFQADGLRSTPAAVNYSTFALPMLHESSLDENAPLTTDATVAGYGTWYDCPNPNPPIPNPKPPRYIKSLLASPVDWNCDGVIATGVKADVNGDDTLAGAGVNDLTSQIDWTAPLRFNNLALSGSGASGAGPSRELTVSGANRTPVPPTASVKARTQGKSVNISWTPVGSGRVRGYEVRRIVPNAATLMFDTTETSYVDRLATAVPAVHYEVRTLYVPFGATGLVRITPEKKDRNGFAIATVGKTQEEVPLLLADPVSARQLAQYMTLNGQLGNTDFGTPPATGGGRGGRGGGGAAANPVPQLTNLLSSDPAAIDVKFQ